MGNLEKTLSASYSFRSIICLYPTSAISSHLWRQTPIHTMLHNLNINGKQLFLDTV